jgi:hypothetical protein
MSKRDEPHNRRAGRYCSFCGIRLAVEQAEFFHIIPLSRGGANESDSLNVMCRHCNFAASCPGRDQRSAAESHIIERRDKASPYGLNSHGSVLMRIAACFVSLFPANCMDDSPCVILVDLADKWADGNISLLRRILDVLALYLQSRRARSGLPIFDI